MLDYDKIAQVDKMQLASGTLNVGDEEEDPWELVVPETDFEDEKNNNEVPPLSYRAVKRHQFKVHVRDRQRKVKFNWWRADLKFLPIFSF
jgi:hypothetical protein